ncbi:MAG TPA: tRNA (adenosine(37)-N6)-threonylcarbamoyltransferase complex ATPase subunit type 1 TsaE, partial [Pyrinomonadaceae bacterium]|nr:tRNA (adenosine(37)-N6)-threonylcarbamoyltransferase complex ATPase subunit type 1 TsaE [Pyrinomonadaceae bacterium]
MHGLETQLEGTHECGSPEDTYALGMQLGQRLRALDAVLLHGGLGAGKTLLTKGILDALGFDPDEVASPSFALVNLYKMEDVDVYHIDLWRIDDGSDAALGVGLGDIVEQPNAIVIIEWAERLGRYNFSGQIWDVTIAGDGDDARKIDIRLNASLLEADA